MSKTPRKIGLIVSGGTPWEIVFCSFFIEKMGYLKLPLTVYSEYPTEDIADYEADLARGKPEYIGDYIATDIEALIMPGGLRLLSAASEYDTVGDGFKIDEDVRSLIRGLYRIEKPIGAFGASALLVSRALQDLVSEGIVVTVGNNPKIQAGIEGAGAQAVITRPSEVVLDEKNKLATCGGELGTKRPIDIYSSCENLLAGVEEFIKHRK